MADRPHAAETVTFGEIRDIARQWLAKGYLASLEVPSVPGGAWYVRGYGATETLMLPSQAAAAHFFAGMTVATEAMMHKAGMEVTR